MIYWLYRSPVKDHWMSKPCLRLKESKSSGPAMNDGHSWLAPTNHKCLDITYPRTMSTLVDTHQSPWTLEADKARNNGLDHSPLGFN